jgi:hypothetical protein
MGGAALALLLVGQVVAAVASRCFCCGAALRPGGARGCALMLFLSSWLVLSIHPQFLSPPLPARRAALTST